MNETFPVLYILVRNDLKSMNPGKAMAQASHASNAFEKAMSSDRAKLVQGKMEDDELEKMRPIIGMADQWKTETCQGFGTVLTLAVNEVQMRTAVDVANNLGFTAEVIHDPTYPILIPIELGQALSEMDNHSVFQVGEHNNYLTIPLDTCAYVFGDKNDPMLEAVVGRFPLHP